MKINSKAVLAVAVLSALSGTAAAEQFYVGANITQMNFDEGDFEAKPANASINAGYVLGQGVSAELRLGDSIASDDLNNVDAELEFKETVGLFVRAAVPETTTITPYALVGYSSINLGLSSSTDEAEERDHDISYGFGVEYKATSDLSVGLEWMDFYRKDDTSVIGYSLTARMGF